MGRTQTQGRSDRDQLLRYLDKALDWLRPAAGACVVFSGPDKNQPDAASWLDEIGPLIGQLYRLRCEVAESEGWQ